MAIEHDVFRANFVALTFAARVVDESTQRCKVRHHRVPAFGVHEEDNVLIQTTTNGFTNRSFNLVEGQSSRASIIGSRFPQIVRGRIDSEEFASVRQDLMHSGGFVAVGAIEVQIVTNADRVDVRVVTREGNLTGIDIHRRDD